MEFTILCATRTVETIGANWSEFDFEEKTWTIPAGRRKMGKKHNIPLSDRAVEILKGLKRQQGSELVFPLSNMAMLQCLRGLRPGLTVHGFRSTFMDWAHDTTSFPKVVIDLALAHAIGDKVEAAYRRGDLFEKRRHVMMAWGEFIDKRPATITPIRKAAVADA